MKTLKDVKVGETATVAKLHGEGPVKRRIMDMGSTITVVNEIAGNLILQVKESRIALDKTMANRIMIG